MKASCKAATSKGGKVTHGPSALLLSSYMMLKNLKELGISQPIEDLESFDAEVYSFIADEFRRIESAEINKARNNGGKRP